MVLWSGVSVIPHSRQVCLFSLRYISASRYVRPYRSFTSIAMILLVGSNGGLPVRLLRHVGGALSRTSLTVERNSRRVIPSMVNSPSQLFRTKHLIWFRDRAENTGKFATIFDTSVSVHFEITRRFLTHNSSRGWRRNVWNESISGRGLRVDLARF